MYMHIIWQVVRIRTLPVLLRFILNFYLFLTLLTIFRPPPPIVKEINMTATVDKDDCALLVLREVATIIFSENCATTEQHKYLS